MKNPDDCDPRPEPDYSCFERANDDQSFDSDDMCVDNLEKDACILEAEKQEDEDIVLDTEYLNKDGDNDFVMEDISKQGDGDSTKKEYFGEVEVVPKKLQEDEKKLGGRDFCGGLFGEIGSDIQMEASKEATKEKDDSGVGEWHVLSASNDVGKTSSNDSMSSESNQDSHDGFDFDSDDEMEETKRKSYDVAPFIPKAFDMNLLRDSIERGEKSLREIDGKNVILIVGKTGTGKSTLIQGIAGKKFTKKPISCGGTVSKDVFEAEDPVAGFEIGHEKVSTTTHVKTFLRKGGKTGEVIYLDTPGFEDTGGEEIDIATSIMLRQVAKKSRTLRFVMMVNYVSLLEDRGGAMRSILKFMRNFVRDFNKEKKSFMFLFTHADEIKDVPESLKGAKEFLLEEVIGIIGGTKDEGVIELLSFIRKSLEKGYPFVDVLHPLKTDYGSLVDFMENKLKPTKRILNVNGGCVLTLSSQMTLNGEAQKLLRNLRVLLGRGNVDITEVCEIKKTFQYFEKYVAFEDMRASVRDCNELIAGHVTYLREILERELDNGTSSTSYFSEASIEHLNDALWQLQTLDLSFDLEFYKKKILKRVCKFQEGLFVDAKSFNLDGYHQDLEKLKIWCCFDSKFESLLELLIDHIVTHVARIKDELCEFDIEEIHSHPDNELRKLHVTLKSSKSIRENAQRLSPYIKCVPSVLEALDNFVSRLESRFQILNEGLVEFQELINFGDDEVMENITNQIRSIERTSELLRGTGIEEDILPLVEFVQKQIESKVVGRFDNICSRLKETDFGSDLDWCKGLTNLRESAHRFSVFKRNRWNTVRSSYHSVLYGLKLYLKTQSENLNEMSREARDHGLVSGMRDGELVGKFAKYQWFDDFLPPEEQFVRNCVTKIMFDYSKIFSDTAEAATGILFWLSSAEYLKDKHFSTTKELKTIASVISEFKIFGLHVVDAAMLDRIDRLSEQLETYIIDRKEKWRATLEQWSDAIEEKSSDLEKVTSTTELLNFALCEIEEIIDMKCSEEAQKVVTSVKDEIIVRLTTFKKYVEDSFSSDIEYEEIARILDHVHALRNFSRTAAHLPILEPLRKSTMCRVRKDAEKIEKIAVSAINFTELDSLITDFQKAEALDEFLDNEVRNRLRLLRRLRADRAEGAEKLVDSMIEQNDFASLGAVLEPLKTADDLYEKHKFTQYAKKVEKHISETDEKLKKIFYGTLTEEKGKSIAELLKILEQAKEAVEKYLPRRDQRKKNKSRSGSISSIVSDWKTKINEKLSKIVSRMQQSVAQPDFVESVKYEKEIIVCNHHLAPFLTTTSERKIKKVLNDYTILKLSIPSKIKTYVSTSFREFQELEKILKALKSTTVMKEPEFIDLSQHYYDSAHILQDRVRESFEKIKESAEETHCYDDSIEILRILKRSLESGLRDHLPMTIENDCSSTLKGYVAIRQQELTIDIELLTDEYQLKNLVKKLDRLDPGSSWWRTRVFGFDFSGKKTYENLRVKIEDSMLLVYRQGSKALQHRDFSTLNEKLHLLSVMNDTLVRHVPQVCSKVQELQSKTVEAFQVLCKESQEALQSDNCRAFEQFFPDYRDFVMSITTLMEDHGASTSFKLINQLVYERMAKELATVEEELLGLDFEAIKQKVNEIRIFGGFIADRFSLFHEQLKAVEHVKSDIWLGLLRGLITKHFQNGRDLRRLKYYAILNVLPSSTSNEIKGAYEDKFKELSASNENDKLVLMKEAMRSLENDEEYASNLSSKPFDDQVRSLGSNLRKKTRDSLEEEDYDQIDRLLFNLQGIEIIEHLVHPKLDVEKIRDDVYSLVKDHIKKVRIEVNSNWSQRKYQDLNHNIKDLKLMEDKFKSYNHIFSSSWNTGIVESVEKEIDKLGQNAMSHLESRSSANQNRDEFRRCFMRMGAVLTELPQFKDFTKKVMSDVLESCLNSEWGYGFVFDLGLSLQKGEDTNDEDEVRIAQNLVTEFGHFKEVLTMVWNEETIQKPAEDTVRDIRGDLLDMKTLHASLLDIDSDELLNRFFDFESEYKSLLGEYLIPGADLNDLVQKIVEITNKMKPISCDNGFGDETKLALPKIIAGVFTLFTILKSGDSYYRFDDLPEAESLKSKLLMKPHNIQIMTLLCMFGCGTCNSATLRSQLMQIRTGEGKSMILGGAATIFGLLGFKVRCVCYSEYLSNRDFELFRDVFVHFGLLELINYSMITTLSEEATGSKGNIREMTLSLMRAHKSATEERIFSCTDDTGCTKDSKSNPIAATNSRESSKRVQRSEPEEIMLVDEVDVFFGSEFYGQTYNQVAELNEPEVAAILRKVWEAHKRGGRRLRLADIKASDEYKNLNLKRIPGFDFVLDNEISLMLDQVRRVDGEPFYYLDQDSGRIGYKIQDTISYKVTYGYRTVFAYLKEADSGNLKNIDTTLSRVLTMPISCGQFSYANIKPNKILGVSGTLEVMSDYEKSVLQKYGVSQYLYIPSVYGHSNFEFDKGGDGVSIERGLSDYFQKITDEISKVATKQKRAVIVFFNNSKRLNMYTSSAFYRKLGRKKEILTENKSANEKAFVISKAATSGQITICSAVFGRGTDFFSKDDCLDNNGGVHVIQTFLSSDMSEEIQIQGRTARQGKRGSYKLILLDEDLKTNFDIAGSSFDNWPRGEIYTRLCEARNKSLENKYQAIDMMLSKSTAKDKATHDYFDALLASNLVEAKKQFKDLYCDMKKKHTGIMNLDLAFAIDITGSMAPFSNAVTSTIQSLLSGSGSILTKLSARFPETKFKLRVAVLGFRDIDDGSAQFKEKLWSDNSHFGEDVKDAIRFIKTLTASASGGSDLAEDHLGAIQRCAKWDAPGDWEGMIRVVLLITDAPAHGYAGTQTIDSYDVRHPLGLTIDSVVEEVVEKDVDLYFCSFDPVATEKFEDAISETYYDHPSNLDGREVTLVPLVTSGMMSDSKKHNIFVLDESGSMQYEWAGVVSAYNEYKYSRRQRQHDSDLVSVVQFSNDARATCQMQNITNAPNSLGYTGGGTCFSPAAESACNLARRTPPSHNPVVIFMSDGMADDSHAAASHFSALNQEVKNRTGHDLELHVIGFGGGTDTRQLQEISSASANGRVHTASDIDSLSKVFVQISGGGNDVASVLEAEISRRISDAVTNRLSAEYFG